MREASYSPMTPEKVQLGEFNFRLRERFLYEYDFYDCWKHDVRLEEALPRTSRSISPLCTSRQRLAPPEDCGGARVYMEESGPRWWEWWDAIPRREPALMSKTVERVLHSNGDRPIVADRQSLLAALERVKIHRAACPERIDGPSMNGCGTTLAGKQTGCFVTGSGMEWSAKLRQVVKTQDPLNGELSHGVVTQTVRAGV